MLSYRHGFHAGNFGDVIKHIVLVEILEHLGRKDAAFTYIDTHAGAGLYDLRSSFAKKLQEHQDGVSRLRPPEWPELTGYFAAIQGVNAGGEMLHYPGSPLIALGLMRPQDNAWLFELHPADFRILKDQVGRRRAVQVQQEDGFVRLPALLPPPGRRGLVLIDPSYEIKADYDRVIRTLVRAHERFATGIYAIWYPVVLRSEVDRLLAKLLATGIRHIQRFELGAAPDSDQRGMTAAGMIVINPPFGLRQKMALMLPRLAVVLRDEPGTFRNDVLVEQ